jgi:ribonucleoside-diphosphate reductase beta chain
LKKWSNGDDDPVMQELFNEEIGTITEMYYTAVMQEKDWSSHLFRDGSMMGLNDRILNEFVEYIAGKRMRAIGIKNEYSKKNPISWIDKHLVSSDNQVAPQETEIISYIVGGVVHDVNENSFSNISLD